MSRFIHTNKSIVPRSFLTFFIKNRRAKDCPDALHCYKADSEVLSELRMSKELQLMQSLKLGLQFPILLAWMYF